MKFFNIDAHVSVIEDVSTQLQTLGHEVESHLLSGHYWALKKPAANQGIGDPDHGGRRGYGAVHVQMHETLWTGGRVADLKAFCDRFHRDNQRLEEFDGFIATYPPSFALLYELFRGHVIVDIPIRYETPFTSTPDYWAKFNDYLVRGTLSGKVTVVANSLYDAMYYEYFTGHPITPISSTCEYIDRFAPKYDPKDRYFLSFGEHAGCRALGKAIPEVRFIRDLYPTCYNHEVLSRAWGIVWIPYAPSIMSFFEHYWLNIPLFVPSKNLLMFLHEKGWALSQLPWVGRTGSPLPRAGTDLPDPLSASSAEAWLSLYDFYNEKEFPYITYFDSLDDLAAKLEKVDLKEISAAMGVHNQARREHNLGAWKPIVARAEAWGVL